MPKGRRRLQMEIYERERGRCFYCDRPVRFNHRRGMTSTVPDTATLDHIIPKSLGGKWNPENLVLACGECNHDRSDQPADAWLLKKRAAIDG